MAYFIKLTHSYGPKNRLQEAALSVAHSLDNYQLELPQELTHFVEDRIMRMNRNFNRCKALTVTLRPSHRQDDYLLYISDLATLTLYKSKGQFAPESREGNNLLRPVGSPLTGPQLDIFTDGSTKTQ